MPARRRRDGRSPNIESKSHRPWLSGRPAKQFWRPVRKHFPRTEKIRRTLSTIALPWLLQFHSPIECRITDLTAIIRQAAHPEEAQAFVGQPLRKREQR